MGTQRRTGRPTVAAKEGQKATLGIRASASLKRKLLAAGEINGRGLSAEAELRLEQSFVVERLLNSALLDLLDEIDRAGRSYAQQHEVEGDWLLDPESYMQAFLAGIARLVERIPGPLDEKRLFEIFEGALLLAQHRRLRTAAGGRLPDEGFLSDDEQAAASADTQAKTAA